MSKDDLTTKRIKRLAYMHLLKEAVAGTNNGRIVKKSKEHFINDAMVVTEAVVSAGHLLPDAYDTIKDYAHSLYAEPALAGGAIFDGATDMADLCKNYTGNDPKVITFCSCLHKLDDAYKELNADVVKMTEGIRSSFDKDFGKYLKL